MAATKISTVTINATTTITSIITYAITTTMIVTIIIQKYTHLEMKCRCLKFIMLKNTLFLILFDACRKLKNG